MTKVQELIREIKACKCPAHWSGKDEAHYCAMGCPKCICDPLDPNVTKLLDVLELYEAALKQISSRYDNWDELVDEALLNAEELLK